jgi:hypothetical protein
LLKPLQFKFCNLYTEGFYYGETESFIFIPKR